MGANSPMQQFLQKSPVPSSQVAETTGGTFGVPLGLAAASPFVALLGKALLGGDDD